MSRGAGARRWGLRHSPSTLLMYLGLFVAIQWNVMAVAWADGPNVGALSAFDVPDSKGIGVSRYALALDPGVMDPNRAMLVAILSMCWDSYRWALATLAVVLDWTTDMGWVPMITGPVSDAMSYLKTSLLGPIGATGFGQGGLVAFLLMLSALVGGIKVMRGRSGGWMTMLKSMLVATLAIGFLGSPVVLLAGDDVQASKALRYVQRTGVQLSTLLTTGEAPEGHITDPPATKKAGPGGMVPDAGDVSADYGKTRHGTIIIDSFVVPVHQVLNYGQVLDGKCAPVYEKALREAKTVADLQKVRDKIGDAAECDDKYKAYADDFSWSRLFATLLFQGTGALMGVFLLVFVLLLWRSVARLVWNAVLTVFHVLWAMAPGPTMGGLLRSLINAGIELIYVVSSTVVLGVVLAVIKATFAGADGDIVARFLVVCLILLGGVGLLIANLVVHLKMGKSLLDVAVGRMRQHMPGRSVGERAKDWATSGGGGAGGGVASALGGAAVGAGAAGSVAGGMRRVLNSNGGRVAMGAAKIAAGAASGGTSVAMQTALTAGKTMRRAGRLYSGFRAGQGGLKGGNTTGSILADTALNSVAGLHNKAADRVDDAKSYYRSQMTGAHRGRETTGSVTGDRLLGGLARTQRRLGNRMRRREDEPDLKVDPELRDFQTRYLVDERKRNRLETDRPDVGQMKNFITDQRQMARDNKERRRENTARAAAQQRAEKQAKKEERSPLAKVMSEQRRLRRERPEGAGPKGPQHADWTRRTRNKKSAADEEGSQ